MGPYLLAACMWYSEADVGPGAEAGSASEGDALIKKNVFLHCVLQHRCGRVQASFASTRRWALALRPEHHPVHLIYLHQSATQL